MKLHVPSQSCSGSFTLLLTTLRSCQGFKQELLRRRLQNTEEHKINVILYQIHPPTIQTASVGLKANNWTQGVNCCYKT